MKNNVHSNFKFAYLVFAIALFLGSCSDDTSVLETPDIPTDGGEEPTETVATLIFNENDPSQNVFSAEANGQVGTTVPGRVIFTTTDTKQKRMYVTQNISGEGETPFTGFGLVSDDLATLLKADGSVDLDAASKNEIDFTFALPVPDIDNGQIEYRFWTTTGKGDFRDPEKRKALGVGTITVTVGTGTNPAAPVREFTEIQLKAPAADGTTESFFSFLNETVYRINVGPEFRAFWDFGYYYGASGPSNGQEASFASTAAYNTSFGFPVEGLVAADTEEDAENETLNNTYFATSTREVSDFDAITLSGELNSITKSDAENITNLSVDDVIEFVDNYGKKGLIKITAIQAGFENNDFIEFDVKIQP